MWQWLQDADTNWQFDIFAFSAQAEGHALSLLSFHFFERFNVAEKFGMDPVKLATFVRVIEKGYDPQNPYHNRYGSKEQSYAFVAGVYGGLSPAQGNWRQLRERAAMCACVTLPKPTCKATLLTHSTCLGLPACLHACPGCFFANIPVLTCE